MRYFPMFLDLSGKEVLICGGTRHALEKIEKLRPFHPLFHVISENVPDDFPTETVRIDRRRFCEKDLEALPAFVIAAEDTQENKRIAAICRQKNIPVNAVDQPEDCDFIFPSMVVTDYLCAAVSTSGVSPTGAVCLKNRVAELIPDDIDAILMWVRSQKEILKEQNIDRKTVNQLLKQLMNKALDERRILTDAEIQALLKQA